MRICIFAPRCPQGYSFYASAIKCRVWAAGEGPTASAPAAERQRNGSQHVQQQPQPRQQQPLQPQHQPALQPVQQQQQQPQRPLQPRPEAHQRFLMPSPRPMLPDPRLASSAGRTHSPAPHAQQPPISSAGAPVGYMVVSQGLADPRRASPAMDTAGVKPADPRRVPLPPPANDMLPSDPRRRPADPRAQFVPGPRPLPGAPGQSAGLVQPPPPAAEKRPSDPRRRPQQPRPPAGPINPNGTQLHAPLGSADPALAGSAQHDQHGQQPAPQGQPSGQAPGARHVAEPAARTAVHQYVAAAIQLYQQQAQQEPAGLSIPAPRPRLPIVAPPATPPPQVSAERPPGGGTTAQQPGPHIAASQGPSQLQWQPDCPPGPHFQGSQHHDGLRPPQQQQQQHRNRAGGPPAVPPGRPSPPAKKLTLAETVTAFLDLCSAWITKAHVWE